MIGCNRCEKTKPFNLTDKAAKKCIRENFLSPSSGFLMLLPLLIKRKIFPKHGGEVAPPHRKKKKMHVLLLLLSLLSLYKG